jgi:hypothetical protein
MNMCGEVEVGGDGSLLTEPIWSGVVRPRWCRSLGLHRRRGDGCNWGGLNYSCIA